MSLFAISTSLVISSVDSSDFKPRGYQHWSMAPFHFSATDHGAAILLPGRRDAPCRDG
jgi:hypothetical protein